MTQDQDQKTPSATFILECGAKSDDDNVEKDYLNTELASPEKAPTNESASIVGEATRQTVVSKDACDKRAIVVQKAENIDKESIDRPQNEEANLQTPANNIQYKSVDLDHDMSTGTRGLATPDGGEYSSVEAGDMMVM